MFTSENKKTIQLFYIKNWVTPYFFTTLFCLLFSYVYSLFSHGVSSPHMTFLFAYPLVFGVLAGLMLYGFEKKSADYFWASHLYHTGVTALILGSLLRGVFDIAGTASIYQTALTAGGAAVLFCGVACFVFCKIRQRLV